MNFQGESNGITKLSTEQLEMHLNEISLILPQNEYENVIVYFIDKANEIVNESHIENIQIITNEIENEIQKHRNNFDKIIDEIVNFYKNKLETNSEIIKKAKINFILMLIKHIHENKINMSFESLQEMYQILKSKIICKESTKEIEKYLIDEVNSIELSKLPQILSLYEEFNDLNAKKTLTIDDIFTKMFGKANSKGSKCIIGDFIELINEKDVKDDIKKTNSILKFTKIINSILQNIYFNSYEEQNIIYELKNELISYFDYFLYLHKEKCKQFKIIKQNLNDLFETKSYKINNFIRFLDYSPTKVNKKIKNYGINNLLSKVRLTFEDMNLLVKVKLNVEKKSLFVNNLNSKLKTLRKDLHKLSEIYVEEQISFLTKDIVQPKHNNIDVSNKISEFKRKRCNTYEIINSKNKEEIIKLTRMDLILIPKKLKLMLISRYKEEFSIHLDEYLEITDENEQLIKQIINIFNTINKTEDLNLKLFFYLNYYSSFTNIKEIKIAQLNELSEKVLLNVYGVNINFNFFNSKIDMMVGKTYFEKLNINDLNSLNKNLEVYLKFLSNDSLNKNQIEKLVENTWNEIKSNKKKCQKDLLILNKLILDYYRHNCYFNIKIMPLIDRLMKSIDKLRSNSDLKIIEDIFGIILKTDENSIHSIILNNCLKRFDYEVFLKIFLTREEFLYAKYLGPNLVKKLVKQRYIALWRDSLENEYIESICESMLVEEMKIILNDIKTENVNFKVNFDCFIKSSYFFDCEQSFNRSQKCLDLVNEEDIKKLDLLSSIKIFKDYLFYVKEIDIDKNDTLELFETIKELKMNRKINLIETTEILMYSRHFEENIKNLTFVLKSDSNNSIYAVVLATIRQLLIKIFNIDSKDKETNIIIKKFSNSLSYKAESFMKLLIEKIYSDYSIGKRYEKSEIEILKKAIDMCLVIGIFEEGKTAVLKNLEKTPLLKWNSTLRADMIECELNRSDSELINGLLSIEKNKGVEITQRFINIIKNTEINDLLIKYITKKFQKNEWEFNCYTLDLIENEKNTSKWVSIIKEYNFKEKIKTLSASELINEMKRLQGTCEINSYVSDLLEKNNKDEKCIIEKCLENIDKVYKNSSSLCENLNEKICEYDDKKIKEWTNKFKEISKVDLKAIDCDEVIELIAIISRASEIVNKHQLRTTQKISLLIFIYSILFHIYSGRLANISTGEGKSLITISTAIAQLLIRGGTVDILTSSEVLAERDANESVEMFKIFGISVSNNCDSEANSNENLRKERYEKNTVIYGEIGHFQRDILLTKYYDKNIRNQLGTCLIIDEVDSMCIDNMCNTLYISHQIADLRYLKEIYCYIWQAVNLKDTKEYTIVNVNKIVEFIEKLIKENRIHYPRSLDEFIVRKLKTWINNAYIARDHIQEGNHYSILGSGKKINEAVINDLQTGVEQMNTQWSEGLQQFIQLKHTNKLTEESLKAIFMSNYIFFKQYGGNIYGMTGTLGAKLERDLLSKAYSLDFYQLPRFKKELNIKEDDVLVQNRPDWIEQIKNDVNRIVSNNRIFEKNEVKEAIDKKKTIENEIKEIDGKITTDISEEEKKILEKEKEEIILELNDLKLISGEIEVGRNNGGRAVLIICENKKDVNDVVKTLSIEHRHLYDYKGKVEGIRKVEGTKRKSTKIDVVRPGDVIVATNVAGRGTDFKISRLLQENGGLHVIITYLPTNIRVELQGFGRSGRKGENGSGRMIIYDKRIKEGTITIENLKEERDEYEEERLEEIRIKMIPRVTLERELFERFDNLQKSIKNKFCDSKFKDLQIISLHNKWAFWLDTMSNQINNVYQSEEINKKEIFNEFEQFLKGINEKMNRRYRGIEGLIDEPGELIKLAKLNIEEGNFKEAIENCNYIINFYGARFCPFSYYYKALALFRPLNNKDWDVQTTFGLDRQRRNFKGYIISFEEKRRELICLKKQFFFLRVK